MPAVWYCVKNMKAAISNLVIPNLGGLPGETWRDLTETCVVVVSLPEMNGTSDSALAKIIQALIGQHDFQHKVRTNH